MNIVLILGHSAYCDTCYRSVVCPSVCVYVSSVTLVHLAEAIERNEMPFGKDTAVVQSNTVLERGHGHHGKRRFRASEPQFAATPPIAKLLWPLFTVTMARVVSCRVAVLYFAV